MSPIAIEGVELLYARNDKHIQRTKATTQEADKKQALAAQKDKITENYLELDWLGGALRNFPPKPPPNTN